MPDDNYICGRMEIHILNGEALTDRMQAAGFTGLTVARECLIDGPVQSTSFTDFWNTRAEYISKMFGDDKQSYYDLTVSEFEKLKTVDKDSSIHVWFGDDLFCQANMWFTITWLQHIGLTENLYRVFPLIAEGAYRWGEFGNLTPADLKESYYRKVRFTDKDVQLALNLWTAYSNSDFEQLKKISVTPTDCFHDLEAVVQAHIDRFPPKGMLGRPEKALKEIIDSGITGFGELFQKFFNSEGGIYGFGDDQVKHLLQRINQ